MLTYKKTESTKDHKFFERYLDNDLEKMTKELENRYKLIQEAKVHGVTDLGKDEYWLDSGSISTVKWRQYNVFQFHISGLHTLYKSISDMVHEACEYYEIDFDSQQFMMQGWFNINEKQTGLLNWHDHGEPGAPNFHGYYCVNAEPSVTHYRVFDKEIDNVNKNNRAVVSEMGHPHAQGEWDWEGKRITVAYDIIPLAKLPNRIDVEQHWIPLI